MDSEGIRNGCTMNVRIKSAITTTESRERAISSTPGLPLWVLRGAATATGSPGAAAMDAGLLTLTGCSVALIALLPGCPGLVKPGVRLPARRLFCWLPILRPKFGPRYGPQHRSASGDPARS